MDRKSNKKARMVDVVSADRPPRCSVSKVRSVLGLDSHRLRGAGMAPSTSKQPVARLVMACCMVLARFWHVSGHFEGFSMVFPMFSCGFRPFRWRKRASGAPGTSPCASSLGRHCPRRAVHGPEPLPGRRTTWSLACGL